MEQLFLRIVNFELKVYDVNVRPGNHLPVIYYCSLVEDKFIDGLVILHSFQPKQISDNILSNCSQI